MKPTSVLAAKLAGEVKAELARKGITATALSEYMGLHRQTVGLFLNSKRSMSIDDLSEICLLVGVEPEILIARAKAS